MIEKLACGEILIQLRIIPHNLVLIYSNIFLLNHIVVYINNCSYKRKGILFKPNTFGSFPESNHACSALQFVNDCLSVKANDKSSQGSTFSGFGASSFPGNFKSKDFEIHVRFGPQGLRKAKPINWFGPKKL
jgi:hypothetical protein